MTQTTFKWRLYPTLQLENQVAFDEHRRACAGPLFAASGDGVYFNGTFPCCGNAVGRALPVSFEGCQSAALLWKYFSSPLGQPEGSAFMQTDCRVW